MEIALLTYLFLASFSLFLFWLVYYFFLANLTHFSWLRFYLLIAVGFSLLLPFIPTPYYLLPSFMLNEPMVLLTPLNNVDFNIPSPNKEHLLNANPITSFYSIASLVYFLIVVYLTGLIIKSLYFIENLNAVRQLISSNSREKIGKEWIVEIPQKGTPFSFFNYIFLTDTVKDLSTTEIHQVKAHERIHIQKKHSLDILFLEIATIILWFNPFIYWVKSMLKDVHEYFVDNALTTKKDTKKAYAELLLKLSSPMKSNVLTTQFTNKQIGRRIAMMAKPSSAPYLQLKFLFMFPIIIALLLFSACFNETNQRESLPGNVESVEIDIPNKNANSLKIGAIKWDGNTIYSDEELNSALMLQKGDPFNEDLLQERLYWDGNSGDISSLYLNRGYAYFKIDIVKKQRGDVIDLIFTLFEGLEVSIANIKFVGNKTISNEVLKNKLNFKEGDLFNRSKIIAAQKTFAEMGKFDPEAIGINTPIREDNGQMNVEFTLVELK